MVTDLRSAKGRIDSFASAHSASRLCPSMSLASLRLHSPWRTCDLRCLITDFVGQALPLAIPWIGRRRACPTILLLSAPSSLPFTYELSSCFAWTMNASIFRRSLNPSRAFVPEFTSTPNGRTRSIADRTFSEFSPPARIIGISG
jgi:hypothetical protein